jgi:hypothetical protein
MSNIGLPQIMDSVQCTHIVTDHEGIVSIDTNRFSAIQIVKRVPEDCNLLVVSLMVVQVFFL